MAIPSGVIRAMLALMNELQLLQNKRLPRLFFVYLDFTLLQRHFVGQHFLNIGYFTNVCSCLNM